MHFNTTHRYVLSNSPTEEICHDWLVAKTRSAFTGPKVVFSFVKAANMCKDNSLHRIIYSIIKEHGIYM